MINITNFAFGALIAILLLPLSIPLHIIGGLFRLFNREEVTASTRLQEI